MLFKQYVRLVEDTKNLSEHETPVYVLIAVILTCIVLALQWIRFYFSIIYAQHSFSIILNMGTNIFAVNFLHNKTLCAVLQLGVTMDYSIFLWHSYQEKRKDSAVTRNVQWLMQSQIPLPQYSEAPLLQ
jgi:predicted RND superfamily exporter protein